MCICFCNCVFAGTDWWPGTCAAIAVPAVGYSRLLSIIYFSRCNKTLEAMSGSACAVPGTKPSAPNLRHSSAAQIITVHGVSANLCRRFELVARSHLRVYVAVHYMIKYVVRNSIARSNTATHFNATCRGAAVTKPSAGPRAEGFGACRRFGTARLYHCGTALSPSRLEHACD